MSVPPDSVAVLFPGALGDFICFLPTLHALRHRHSGRLLLVARSDVLDLVDLPAHIVASIDRREIADLFAVGSDPTPATFALFGGFESVHSWTGFGNADFLSRLSMASGGCVSVYRFRGMRPGEHAADYYARCAGVTAATTPPVRIRRDDDWVAAFKQRHQLRGRRMLVLHPGSGSPSKNWDGFAQLVRCWRQHHTQAIVLLCGPAEERCAMCYEPGVTAVDGLTLPRVAALLANCALYLGNDSGISHLAGAVGARAVVLFGPSDPTVWAPRGERVQVIHAPTPCPNCSADTFCVHRLPVDSVVHALEALSTQA
jgi:ADP-heptose:LPS heptosyltransferase